MSGLSEGQNVYLDLVKKGVSGEEIRRIGNALQKSPLLTEQAESAARAGLLRHAGLLPDGNETQLAHYDLESASINFRRSLLSAKTAKDLPYALIHVYGHELYHANHRQVNYQFAINLENKVVPEFIAKNPSQRDYTPIAQSYVQYWRENEAKAELNGANAVISAMKKEGIPITDQSLAKSLKDVSSLVSLQSSGVYKLAPGVHIDPHTLQFNLDDPRVVEAAAKVHFDENPAYRKTYVQGAMALIARAETQRAYDTRQTGAPSVRLDFDALGVSPDQLRDRAYYEPNLSTRGLPVTFLSSKPGTFLGDPRASVTMQPGKPETLASPALPLEASGPERNAQVPATVEGNQKVSALHRELRGLLPEQTSEDRLIQIAVAAHVGGVRSGWISAVRATDDAVFVIGQGIGERAKVDLTQAPPSQTRSVEFAQQHDQFQQVTQQQQAHINQQQSGPKMAL